MPDKKYYLMYDSIHLKKQNEMRIKTFLLALFVTAISCVTAQDKSLFTKEVLVVKGDSLPYRILLPLNYDKSKKYPLIIFLHGSGERGNDNEIQLVHGASLFLRDSIREKYPAIVVFPQCAVNSSWAKMQYDKDSAGGRVFVFPTGGEPTIMMDLTEQLIKKLCKDFKVSKKQLYVGGLSMGGMGTFEIVRRNPKIFAAAFPICGGANPLVAPVLTKTAWWVFHGGKDNVVPPKLSVLMVEALQKEQADVQFTLYPEANHNSWDNAFAESGLMMWLFSKHK